MHRDRQDNDSYSNEIITMNQAIQSIRDSINDEKADAMFYDMLISQAPTDDEKNIIMDIRDNEKRHNNILRDLYYFFTGQSVQNNNMQNGNSTNGLSYQENLEKALFGELDAIVKYRRILGTMPSGDCYTLIMSILTDEIRHACKYNYLIHKSAMNKG